jgi:two-component system chemotaxis response regulator CheY
MKILIAEDEPLSRKLLETFLSRWGYELDHAADGREALERFNGHDAPQLVISDWMMPNMDGLELCRRIRSQNRPDYVYIIILTARGNRADVVKGLQAGADDYVVKPFDQKELKWRIRIGERILDLERRIKLLARTDDLTGALNRRTFMEQAALEHSRALREKCPFALIMADIDHFKQVNDTHGHQAGDVVLQHFTRTLGRFSRPYDLLGRYGGEEFILFLPGAALTDAMPIGERLRKQVAAMTVATPGNSGVLQITASFGVAAFAAGTDEPLEGLIKRADDALYAAKRQGRNRVCKGGS